MVGPDGALPVPWLEGWLQDGITRRAHALLLHGPEGVGQFELALALAQAGLCEAAPGEPAPRRPCGSCTACRLVQAHTHPDLLVLVPEALRERLGWTTGPDTDDAGDKPGKAKPSRDIKVEAVRTAVAFAQTTSSRGRGKTVVLHPAERINAIASNTLLKTLEEPAGNARFVLSCARPEALLPTIRSRCQALRLGLPPSAQAIDWLGARGVDRPEILLAACGGQPLQAAQWSEEGVDAGLWLQLPSLVLRGEAGAFQGWPLPRLVDALQKLCHDALCVTAGGRPRYFPPGAVQPQAGVAALTAWAQRLARMAQQAEHPWSAGLAVETLIDEAQRTLRGRRPARSTRYTSAS